LAIRADVAVDEFFQLRRHVAPFKADAAQDFLCDCLRNILGAIGVNLITRSGSPYWAANSLSREPPCPCDHNNLSLRQNR